MNSEATGVAQEVRTAPAYQAWDPEFQPTKKKKKRKKEKSEP
jgi:hypothetical protein